MRHLTCLLFFFYVVNLGAQNPSVMFKHTNPYMFGSNDLWNFDVFSSSTDNAMVNIQVDIFTKANKRVYTASSGQVQLKNGINSFSVNNITLNSTTFYMKDVERSNEQLSTFPSGVYLWCVTIFDAQTKELKVNTCSDITIEIPTKPILIYPPDGAIIHEFNPLLTWLGGTISAGSETGKYRLSLVEVDLKQNSNEAIFRNRPLLQQSDINSTSLIYPFNSPQLEVGKRYAWRVDLLDLSGRPFATTETWTFTIKLDTNENKLLLGDESYLDIVKSAPNVQIRAKEQIKIKYPTRQFPTTLNYTISKENSENSDEIYEGKLMVLARENWFTINISDISRLKHDEVYRLELTDGNKRYKFYFKYIK